MKDKNGFEPSDYKTLVSNSINNDNQPALKPYLDDVEILDRKYGLLSWGASMGLIMLRCPRCKVVNSLWFEMYRTSDDSKEYNIVQQPCYCAYCGKKLVKDESKKM